MTRGAALTGLLVLLAVPLSCRKAEAPQSSTQPATRVVLKTNITSSMTYAPLVIAKEEGFFADEGIDLELVRIDANSAVLALTTGELDVLSGPIRSGHFNLMNRGLPIRIVADRGHFERGPCSPGAFTASMAMAARIDAAGGDVRGMKVATHRGGITEFVTERFLASRKLTAADVDLVQLPSGGDAAAGSRESIEAIRFLQEPALSNMIGKGLVKPIADIRDLAPGQQYAAVLFGKRLLQDDRPLGQRFMNAYVRGLRQYSEGKTERNVAIISGFTQLPPEVIRQACWLPIERDGSIREDSVETLLTWALERGYLEGALTVDQWWDGGFVANVPPETSAKAREGTP